jgi:signal transduction histidine kinase
VNNEKGVITNFIAIKDDITEKKKFFEELIIAKEKAIESEKLKTAFLANMSHEIRTPLNGIIGFSRMLSESDLASEERQEYSKILNQSCDRLLNTVNDILDISKIESNQMEVRFSLFYLKNVIQELYELHIGNFSKKSINLILNLKQIDDELIIYSDEQKIYQILNNLINNAYKFTELGEVEIGASIKNDYIEFFVRDTGIGISESAIDFIFGRFNQENNNLNRGFEGTGLGLSICKGLVNLLGGKIWLESSQGLGSKFSFNIPYFKNQ